MIFKHQLKRGKGILNRGERCLFRSVEATYLGSFKSEDALKMTLGTAYPSLSEDKGSGTK